MGSCIYHAPAFFIPQVENKSKAAFSSISLKLRRLMLLSAHGATLDLDEEVAAMIFPGEPPRCCF